MYTAADGVIRQVPSPAEIPPEFAASAKCFAVREKAPKPRPTGSSATAVPFQPTSPSRAVFFPKNDTLAPPDEIRLEGSQRQENINSSLGSVSLRWPRKVETLFGRTPLRAMTDAANTVSRALKNGAFPSDMQNLSLQLKVIFLDENLPTEQIPHMLVTNCHPGWMTPPANIYIVAQRVAGGCGTQRSSSTVADSTLGEVLIHELGHVVEFHLLNQRGRLDRMRAEGFATWFEEYASQYSSIVNANDLKRRHGEIARTSIQRSPNTFSFSGSAEDYARASMYFRAIAAPRGLGGLMDVYERMNKSGEDFLPAIKNEFRWDDRRLQSEVLEAAG